MISSDEEIIEILTDYKNIAVIGCSSNPSKAAHEIPKYLQSQGYKIIPVNPFSEEILGEKCYKKITDIKEEVDIVNVFRPSEETPVIVRESLKVNPKVVWMQLGIENKEAEKIAEENNIKIIMNKCMMVEHMKLIGE
ncbi:CoA-binding protein [Bacteroidota bacterium]